MTARAAHLHCLSGISGDMTAAALLDLGADEQLIRESVAALDLGDVVIDIEKVEKSGIRATRFNPRIGPGAKRLTTLGQAEELFARAHLPAEIHGPALKIVRALAEVEAKVHGAAMGDVHFHELGDPDTAVDAVAVAAGLHALGIRELWASPVNTGSGLLKMAHGIFPIPAPATIELLKGFDCFADGEEGEKTTPTGAAILATLARRAEGFPPLTVEATGYGAGTADFHRAVNLLQVTMGVPARGFAADTSTLMESTIDDLNPQVIPHLIERLMAAGALDVFVTPVLMKKGRPGFSVGILVTPGEEGRIGDLLMAESTTIGLRMWPVSRLKGARRFERLETPWGAVQVKINEAGGRTRAVPEFEDCRRIANATGSPLIEIMASLARLAEERFGTHG